MRDGRGDTAGVALIAALFASASPDAVAGEISFTAGGEPAELTAEGKSVQVRPTSSATPLSAKVEGPGTVEVVYRRDMGLKGGNKTPGSFEVLLDGAVRIVTVEPVPDSQAKVKGYGGAVSKPFTTTLLLEAGSHVVEVRPLRREAGYVSLGAVQAVALQAIEAKKPAPQSGEGEDGGRPTAEMPPSAAREGALPASDAGAPNALVDAGAPAPSQSAPEPGGRPNEGEMFGASKPEPAASPSPAAEQRPDEGSMFGGTPSQPAATPAQPSSEGQKPTESSLFGAKHREAETSTTAGPSNPLTIGGFVYLNEQTNYSSGESFDHIPLTLPILAQTYFDARPNDRVRAFLVGRLEFNPLGGATPVGSFGYAVSNAPTVLLDQAWLNFDLEHTVFVTIGKQHIKWGPGRFWNPTDLLNPIKLNPLVPFDVRTGLTMVKLHFPYEALGWNFYALALLDNFIPAAQIGQIGGALRAEIVLGPTEIALSAVAAPQTNYNTSLSYVPKFGASISAGVGPFDVYAEGSVRRSRDVVLVGYLSQFPDAEVSDAQKATQCAFAPNSPGCAAYQPQTSLGSFVQCASATHSVASCQQQLIGTIGDATYSYNPTGIDGLVPQALAGFNFQVALADRAALTLGAEYFYNYAGYSNQSIYPLLLFVQQYQQYFTPLYMGKHYAAAYATLPTPGDWTNTTFTLSTIGNLSDRTFLSRFDVSWVVLTYLTVQLYGQFHYGHAGGELRFALPSDIPAPPAIQSYGIPSFPSPVTVLAPLFDCGIGLRINI